MFQYLKLGIIYDHILIGGDSKIHEKEVRKVLGDSTPINFISDVKNITFGSPIETMSRFFCGDRLVLNTSTREITFDGKPITPGGIIAERSLEWLLLNPERKVFERGEIADALYCSKGIIERALARARGNLDNACLGAGEIILLNRGRGLCFEDVFETE